MTLRGLALYFSSFIQELSEDHILLKSNHKNLSRIYGSVWQHPLVIMKVFMKILDILKKKEYQVRGGIVKIKSFLEVTATKLMLLVYKLLLLVFRVNAASIKVTTAQILRLPKEFLLLEDNG
ncbi:hypothetical protein Tco_0587925 [Tanacetum coccineum]